MAKRLKSQCLCRNTVIAITQGDPVGIGPEVTIKGFNPETRCIHIGDATLYKDTAKFLGCTIPMECVETIEEAAALPSNIFAILPPKDEQQNIVTGDASTTVESIRFACQLAQSGQVQAMVTPPINKAAIHKAGYNFPGHTEMLADYTDVKYPVMMLASKGLRVVPATIHQALADVPKNLTRELLEKIIRTTYKAMQLDFAIKKPRITIAALNPHAGENGAFGREELDFISPLCQELQNELSSKNTGEIRGPLPADTLFHDAARKQYDAVICMYHDQALIPLKMLGFGHAVNITLGLPIVRTSVDHGTAYNIAGKGVADATSFMQAVRLAALIVKNRQEFNGVASSFIRPL
ncbi:MAG: 4-hydroxythreonine-4-phosphate dehydrogenase PdxA [Magnetococcales bacterium]|nr:4-hydroxythreonine-4-phosphate dehydrogenase PdxA [Magnetococcales bacterium]